MITGETESILQRDFFEDDYDAFFGNKKKRRARRAKRKARRLARRNKRKSEPQRIERKAKRKRFFKDVGQIYRDAGGATTIGAAIDAITLPKSTNDYGSTSSQEPVDFSIDMASSQEPEKEKKSIPTVVYVLGGVVVVGVIGMVVVNSKKNKQYQQYS